MSQADSSSWAPNLSPDELWNERSYFTGVLIGAVAYGVHCTLFFIALQLLLARKRSHWKDYIWIAYMVVLFSVSSVANGTRFKFTQASWIDNRNYPGGPGAYLVEQTTSVDLTCNIAYIINGWLQDALIIYRFWVIYGRSFVALAGPLIVFLAEIVLSLWLVVGLTGGEILRLTVLSKLFTSYFAISIGLNILLTLAIVFELMMARRNIGRLVNGSAQYVSVAAMLVESAALYAICGILFLVPWGLQDPVQQLVLPTLGQVESIAPVLIIMRVAQGRAWSADTETRLTTSTVHFVPHADTVELSSMPSKGASTTIFGSSTWTRRESDEEATVKL
ncbi:hypothetical protein EXIGLDRAFT_681546 [Exidia glandulosa HHB12029]|uniref:Family A G protein-coupled receptor-like protein n=1 Tax=Exidia glandulosa HHB12029 TaxID=1314781 RepID=A0A165DZ94_EXIGL|nr:hypothetical protein EXIGLDRAFT_681546 [Exidia glandulosa HHB12029]